MLAPVRGVALEPLLRFARSLALDAALRLMLGAALRLALRFISRWLVTEEGAALRTLLPGRAFMSLLF